MTWHELGLLTPILALVTAAVAVLLLRPGSKSGPSAAPPALALLGIAASFVCVLVLKGRRVPGGETALAGHLHVDGLALVSALIVLLASAVTILFAQARLKLRDANHGEFYALVPLAAAGMMIMTSTNHLVTLFLGLEVMSVSVYVLAGFHRDSQVSLEAATKYFLTGSFASAIMLFGLALTYGAAGRLDLPGLMAAPEGPLRTAGLGLLLTGFLFKIAAVPFHMWAPDVYEGAPAAVTGFMATAVKAAAFTALLRATFHGFLPAGGAFESVLFWTAIATMTVGNLAALAQSGVKRMLAWSSIAHAGYLLAGVAALHGDGSRAVEGVLFYLLGYTVMSLAAFGIVGLLETREGRSPTFEDLAGLRGREPLLAFALALSMISLAGLPPTAGFMAKFSLFGAVFHRGLSTGADRFTVLAVVGILNSLLALVYYLRAPIQSYMKPESGSAVRAPVISGAARLALAVTVGLTIWLGLGPRMIGLGVDSVLAVVRGASAMR